MMLVLAGYGVACLVSLLGSLCIEAWRLLSDRCPPPCTAPLAAVFAAVLSPLVLLLTLVVCFGDTAPRSVAALPDHPKKLERREGDSESDDQPNAEAALCRKGRLSFFKWRDAVHR